VVALEHGPQFGMLLRRGHGEHFNAAVPQISHEATHLHFSAVSCGEVAEAHTLDHSRDEVTAWLVWFRSRIARIVAESPRFYSKGGCGPSC